MKILKSTVKTIYSITLSFHDFLTIFLYASHDDFRKIEGVYEKQECEFSNWDLTNTTMGNIMKAWQEFCHPFYQYQARDIRYIVKLLGYDGVENYGYYDKNKKLYFLSVYNFGDSLNINSLESLTELDNLNKIYYNNKQKK